MGGSSEEPSRASEEIVSIRGSSYVANSAKNVKELPKELM